MSSSYHNFSVMEHKDILQDDPVVCCLSANRGYCSDRFGPKSIKCKEYMSQRCSDKWDDSCQIYSLNQDTFTGDRHVMRTGIVATIGEQFIRNVVERKYCTNTENQNCQLKCEKFNVQIPNSPEVCSFQGNCHKVCGNFTKKEILSDPLIDRILANPAIYGDLIKAIQVNAKKKNIDFAGSKLGVKEGYVENTNLRNVYTTSNIDEDTSVCNFKNTAKIIGLLILVLLLLFIMKKKND
jgi:hypothetical protein